MIRSVAVVSGHVQGVGYRWFVRELATRARLAGSARNLPDGRVEGQEYVALNPPPAREAGSMRVRMGSLRELVDALETSRGEDDLFGLGLGGPGG